MTTYFTSDTHYGHRSILTLGHGRPFDTVEEMDEAMIDRWNAVIGADDDVWHLGDFSFAGVERTVNVINRLQGRIHFIVGNHDRSLKQALKRTFPNEVYNASGFAPTITQYEEIKVEGQTLVLFHFPIASWHHVGSGAWHLHGHCHNNLPQIAGYRLDIGVDGHDFRPWSFDEVADFMAKQDKVWLPGDHHGISDSLT